MHPNSRPRYLFIVLAVLCLVVWAIYLYLERLQFRRSDSDQSSSRSPSYLLRLEQLEDAVIDSWSRSRVSFDLTPLGRWLLSREGTPPPRKTFNDGSKVFLILVWEHGKFLERRHLRRFSRDRKFSAWEGCSVANCKLTYDSAELDRADAVVFHLHRTRGASTLPRRRNYDQRWIFLSDESPVNTFSLQLDQKLSDYDDIFNWSMTYRLDSDVPVPYGRAVLRAVRANFTNYFPRRKLVAVLGSNCYGANDRWRYVEQLKIILGDDFEIMGHCSGGNRTVCPGHFDLDCPALGDFKFYLAFENSNCREYLSEKVWWNGFEKKSVPVIMGARKVDCERLLPPNSFLHVEDFGDPASLAAQLLRLHYDPLAYGRLQAWRSSHRVINEHGYFGSVSKHYCRVCEALNYNSPLPKTYESVKSFLDRESDCS